MYDQSRDELEHVAKTRRIKNPKRMSKEELIIALLKSKRGIAELFDNNIDDDKISYIKRILNRLRDVYSDKLEKKLKKRFMEWKIRKIFQNKKKKSSMNILLG